MLTITIEDLRYRARQFVIAVIGAGLAFAMSLILTGLAAGFSAEINQTVEAMGAQAWVLASVSVGHTAVTFLPVMPASAVSAVAKVPGVTKAEPVIVVPQTAQVGDDVTSVNLIGYRPGAHLGGPGKLANGHPVVGNGQAVVDTGLGLKEGQRFSVAGHVLQVVGVVSGRTLLGGNPNVYVTLGQAQQIVFGGRPLIGAVLVTGSPRGLPAGYTLDSNAQFEKASLTKMSGAVSSIDNLRLLMWVIAAIIVAAMIYVAALERTRDFAVLKAVGASTRVLFAGLAVQAVLVALAAALIGGVLSNFMTGIFTQPVAIPGSAFIALPLLAVAVGLLASLAALRRAVSVAPAAAFAGAS